MQRGFQVSLRLSCRKLCRHRLFSSQAVAVRYPTSAPNDEPVASGSTPNPIGFPEVSPDSSPIQLEAGSSTVKPRRKRKISLENLDSDRPSRSEQNKVDTYLASLRAGGIEPTLDDLERLRPKNKPHSSSPKYPKVYNELVDRLCRTFSKDQLREFGEQLHFDGIWTRSGRRKVEFAESILDQAWGWENLKEIERRKRDMSEVLVKSFNVSPSELFLLLGKDGSELLQISLDYNVHVSVTANPLSIRIEGLRGSLKDLEKMLFERRKAIIEETTELPMKAPLSQELVQQLSRLANAYIENLGNKGKIRICANNKFHLTIAKRLAVRASMLVHHESNLPFLVFLPPDPPVLSSKIYSHTYSLYPFLPHRSLPWTIKSGGTFRCRRVSEWLGEPLGEDIIHSGGLGGGKGKFLTETGDSVSLEEFIRKTFPQTDSIGLTASTGHVLFSDKSRRAQHSLIPPFPGHWQFPKFMTWLQEGNTQRWFIPSLPAPLHNTSPVQEKILHRVTYRRLQTGDNDSQQASGLPVPSKVLKYEVVLTEKVGPAETKELETNGDETDQILSAGPNEELDALLIEDSSAASTTETEVVPVPEADLQPSEAPGAVDLESAALEVTETLEKQLVSGDNESEPATMEETAPQVVSHDLGEPFFQETLELDVLLSLPDRPLDVLLKIASQEQEPAGMDEPVLSYFESIKEFLKNPDVDHPEPPLFLERGGETFILQTSESIRRSEDQIVSNVQKPIDWDSDDEHASNQHVLSTTSESILDLDANQKSVKCELSYQASMGTLRDFLRDLDGITTISYSPSNKTNKIIAIQDAISDEASLQS